MTNNGTPCISGGYVFAGTPEHCKGCVHYNFIESECAKGLTPAWSEEQEAWECDAHKDADQFQYELELKREAYEEIKYIRKDCTLD